MLSKFGRVNSSNINNLGSTQVRTAILIYGAVLLFSIIITDLFFMNKTFLFLFSACLWIPQIIENIWNKSRQIDIEFILVITANHWVFPLYIRGYSGNSLMLEFDLMWAFVFVAFIWMQILVLVMQSRYGVYFFLPNFMRPGRVCFTKVEQINDELKTLEWCICMSSLVTVEDHEEYDAMNEKVTYMETPCGHKYHSSCLTTWIRQKNDWPFCRSPLPIQDDE